MMNKRAFVSSIWYSGGKKNKLFCQLIEREPKGKYDVIEEIFIKVHTLASHNSEASSIRWKFVERRLMNRFKKDFSLLFS